MMSARLVLIAVALSPLFTVPAQAQFAAPIRSGEHNGFSRLVFPAPPGIEWQMDTGADGPTIIRFDAADLRFETSEVFTRIPRDRLTALQADGAELQLTLACSCAVDVQQIASGHVVIDIQDDTPGVDIPTESNAPDEPTPRPVLPLHLPPVATLVSGLRFPQPEAGAPNGRSAPHVAAGAEEPDTPPRPQITIREHSRRNLLPDPASQEGTQVTKLPTCNLETTAADLLMQSPTEALIRLDTLRADVVDDTDTLSVSGLLVLGKTYLALGWGAEALQTFVVARESDESELVRMARAMDGDPDLKNDLLDDDPKCGPATTTLLLITGQFDGDWGSVDEDSFLRFLDRLPDDRRHDLERRLRDGLSRLGQANLLTRLVALPVPPMPYSAPSAEILAAGTGTDAVRTTIAFLEAPTDGGPTPTIHLQNAIALRASIPDGPLHDEFEEVLARRLLLSGFVAEAVDVAKGRPALASTLLSVALDNLSEADLIEVAIRLRPLVRSDAPQIRIVAAIMRTFGLHSAAREFEAIRTGEGLASLPTRWRRPVGPNTANHDLTAPDRAWLDRDFALLAQTIDPAGPTLRQQAAEHVQRRNGATPLADDFDRARAALQDSRRTAEIMEKLLSDPEILTE